MKMSKEMAQSITAGRALLAQLGVTPQQVFEVSDAIENQELNQDTGTACEGCFGDCSVCNFGEN